MAVVMMGEMSLDDWNEKSEYIYGPDRRQDMRRSRQFEDCVAIPWSVIRIPVRLFVVCNCKGSPF